MPAHWPVHMHMLPGKVCPEGARLSQHFSHPDANALAHNLNSDVKRWLVGPLWTSSAPKDNYKALCKEVVV